MQPFSMMLFCLFVPIHYKIWAKQIWTRQNTAILVFWWTVWIFEYEDECKCYYNQPGIISYYYMSCKVRSPTAGHKQQQQVEPEIRSLSRLLLIQSTEFIWPSFLHILSACNNRRNPADQTSSEEWKVSENKSAEKGGGIRGWEVSLKTTYIPSTVSSLKNRNKKITGAYRQHAILRSCMNVRLKQTFPTTEKINEWSQR